jgi:hypothetical protein
MVGRRETVARDEFYRRRNADGFEVRAVIKRKFLQSSDSRTRRKRDLEQFRSVLEGIGPEFRY